MWETIRIGVIVVTVFVVWFAVVTWSFGSQLWPLLANAQ
jgi:hypothetical protein